MPHRSGSLELFSSIQYFCKLRVFTKLVLEVVDILENDAVEANGPRGFDVLRHIVNKNAFLRALSVARKIELEDIGTRLCHALAI